MSRRLSRGKKQVLWDSNYFQVFQEMKQGTKFDLQNKIMEEYLEDKDIGRNKKDLVDFIKERINER